jgi:hypothetical protein
MLKAHVKRIPLILGLRERAGAAARRLHGARHRFTRWLLTTGLVAVYFIVITPVALVRRTLLGRSLAHPGENTHRGWRPIRQSSADKQIYVSDD